MEEVGSAGAKSKKPLQSHSRIWNVILRKKTVFVDALAQSSKPLVVAHGLYLLIVKTGREN